jgi:cell wall-associated NlpC family hydrolase
LTACTPVRSAAGRLLAASVLAAATIVPVQAITSAPAEASVSGTRTVALAAAQRGKPYRYGASGPRAFDCSGLVKYVMNRQHKRVPRTAAQQYRASRKISRSELRQGDLVFFVSRGHVYHVGVYAGRGKIWHAPSSGKRVQLAKIWTSHWVGGRVR